MQHMQHLADWTSLANWAVVEMARRTRPDAGDDDAGGFVFRGAELRSLRNELSLTQRELAAKLAYSHSSICRWEHDQARVPDIVWDLILDERDRLRAKWSNRRHRRSQA